VNVLPDPKFGNTSSLRKSHELGAVGGRSRSRRHVYGELGLIETKTKQSPLPFRAGAGKRDADEFESSVAPRRRPHLSGSVSSTLRSVVRRAGDRDSLVLRRRATAMEEMTERLSAELLDERNEGKRRDEVKRAGGRKHRAFALSL